MINVKNLELWEKCPKEFLGIPPPPLGERKP